MSLRLRELPWNHKQTETRLKLKLKARISRSDAETIRQALDQVAAKGSVREEGDKFVVEAEMEGASAKELNRTP